MSNSQEPSSLRVVQANNDLGFEAIGPAPLVNGAIAINVLVLPTGNALNAIWAIARKVNLDNPAGPGLHWCPTYLTRDPFPHIYFDKMPGQLPTQPPELPNSTAVEVDIESGRMVYMDQSGNLCGSSGVTKVNSITQGGDTATFCPRGTFEIDLEVQTAFGVKPMRAAVTLRPGGRVSFFSAPGKEHLATVAPDGKTLIDVTPPIDLG